MGCTMNEEGELPEAVAAPLVVEFTEEEFELPEHDTLSSAEPRVEFELPRAGPTPPNRGRVVTVMNQKGGVGKTTTSINLSACLFKMKRRVLLVDLDPQSNATRGSGIETSRIQNKINDVLLHREKHS